MRDAFADHQDEVHLRGPAGEVPALAVDPFEPERALSGHARPADPGPDSPALAPAPGAVPGGHATLTATTGEPA